MSSAKPKIIVLDDDPTGSQTVHSCLLLTRWDEDTLRLGLPGQQPNFLHTDKYSIANSRKSSQCHPGSVPKSQKGDRHEKIADFIIVSRSDFTLRGHYPIETDAIAEELGPFDAHFLIPAFFEGGRITRHSVHLPNS